MGLLDLVNIKFTSDTESGITAGRRGVVALLLQDKADAVGDYLIHSLRDIPTTLSEKNQKYIEMTLQGANKKAPTAIYVYVEELIEAVAWDPDKSEAFNKVELGEIDYVAIPELAPADAKKVATWIKLSNENTEHLTKVVLAGEAGDDQHIINFATEEITTDDGTTYTGAEFVPRIAGFIAATEPTRSITYAVVDGVRKVKTLSKKDLDAKAAAGELHLYQDGQKVRFASGVNSLTTLGEDENETYKQIKETEIMDMFHNYVKRSLLDNFIGKYSNSYQNKLLLVTEIKDFLTFFERQGYLEAGANDVQIDFEAQKEYLREINFKTVDGRKVDEMTEQEILRGNTRKKVFLILHVQVLGAIESIDIKVVV